MINLSFEDYRNVVVDYYEKEFTIVRNSGVVYTYKIDDEKDLLIRILEHPKDVEINRIGYEGRNRKGQFIKGSVPWNKGKKMK